MTRAREEVLEERLMNADQRVGYLEQLVRVLVEKYPDDELLRHVAAQDLESAMRLDEMTTDEEEKKR